MSCFTNYVEKKMDSTSVELDMIAHAFDLSTLKVEADGSL